MKYHQEAATQMIKKGPGGSIILITSMNARIVNEPQEQSAYNASKAAVRHLGAPLALEWTKYNIRVSKDT
jgi:NAD(P)-dependent dehydrogenase (short-subunit alcohol dehydrogenase family)